MFFVSSEKVPEWILSLKSSLARSRILERQNNELVETDIDVSNGDIPKGHIGYTYTRVISEVLIENLYKAVNSLVGFSARLWIDSLVYGELYVYDGTGH